MVKVILSGCSGRMGQVITGLVKETPDMEIAAGIDITAAEGCLYPVFSSPAECDVQADVIIDFSSPAVFDALLDYSVSHKIPAVICTTGLSDGQIARLEKESANAGMTHPSRGSLIMPVGQNLFETVMLNSVLFNVKRNELYASVHPEWEEDQTELEYKSVKSVPFDLPRMYTQQARRISLFRKGEKVTGAYVSAGESYAREILWMEPAFMMHEVKDKDSKKLALVPMQCGTTTDIWREIEHI